MMPSYDVEMIPQLPNSRHPGSTILDFMISIKADKHSKMQEGFSIFFI